MKLSIIIITMVTIYILKLTNDKYYVGKSNTVDYRIEQHFRDGGSAYTKLYPPIEVVTTIPNCDDLDEDKFTLQFMKIYGVDNVRGGSFCQVEFDTATLTVLHRMLNGTEDKCYSCGSSKHFAKDCLAYKRMPKTTHYSDTVYDEISKSLDTNEYIIKQAFEHGTEQSYNVCYLTSFGNILYSEYNHQQYQRNKIIRIKKYNYLDNDSYKNTQYKELDYETIIRAKKYTFKSNHYGYHKMGTEFKNLIENNVVSYI